MTNRKGIILAGGTGSRLWPVTQVVSKQLLPVFDKPMIYYPLSTLMLAGIREVAVVCSPRDIRLFEDLLGDGQKLGMRLHYIAQEKPEGIAQALILAENFLDQASCALILGDNIFYGNELMQTLALAGAKDVGCHIFASRVSDPKRYGVVTFDEFNNPEEIVEKPDKPKSNLAVTGLYFYDSTASARAKKLTPSSRGELEITDLNSSYLTSNSLSVEELGRGVAWFDVGTQSSFLDASNFIASIQKRQGQMIACPEEISLSLGWITKSEFEAIANFSPVGEYGNYLKSVSSKS